MYKFQSNIHEQMAAAFVKDDGIGNFLNHRK